MDAAGLCADARALTRRVVQPGAVAECRVAVTAVFVSFEGLLRLKPAAGRPSDLDDIERLRVARFEKSDG